MLDVHAPEHSISNVREFFIHLFTITCGLLIALGLENAAEAVHHRNERKEAEASIREEMTQNRKDLAASKAELVNEIRNMNTLLAFATARSLNKPTGPGDFQNIVFREGPIPDAAWRTANSTGAVSFMPYSEVERFAAAYKEQDLLQTTAEAALNDFLELGALAPRPANGAKLDVTPELAQQSLPYIRRTLAHLEGVYAVGMGALASYDDALKQ